MKAIYEKSTSNHIQNGKKLTTFLPLHEHIMYFLIHLSTNEHWAVFTFHKKKMK
jgi:hypothetical protein